MGRIRHGRSIVATQTETLWTVARIADHLGVARHRVEYIIDSRGITPIGRAGIARVFDRRHVDRIGDELRGIEADREGASLGN